MNHAEKISKIGIFLNNYKEIPTPVISGFNYLNTCCRKEFLLSQVQWVLYYTA